MKFLSFQIKIGVQEQIDFARDLSVLLSSGVTLREAVSTLREQAKSVSMKKLLKQVEADIDHGTPLSVTLDKSNIRLRDVFISLVKAGEVSGSLAENLIFVSEWLERDRELRQEVKSVTLYPKIVLTAAGLLGAGLALFVLPRLIPVFEGMNIELPAITRAVLWLALFVELYTKWIILGILLLLVLYTTLIRWTPTRRFMQKIYMHTPYFGEIIICYQLALYSQLMNVLIKSGLTINQSFEIASIESTNVPYQDSFYAIKDNLLRGVGLSDSVKNFPTLYPANFISTITVGERTGTLEKSFANMAIFYNKKINAKTKNLPTVIEPVLLIGIGVIVGLIALSIILPIYTLSSSLR